MVRKKWKKRDIALGLAFVLVVILILIFYIWHQARLFHLGIENGRLENQVKSLQKEVETLEAKKATLLSLKQVEERAEKELNLKKPREDQLIDWERLAEERKQRP